MLTEINKEECGIVIARFQTHTLHEAHKQLIETVLAQHSRVMVFLGCSPLRNTARAPLDFKHRKAMLEEIYGNKIEIYPVYDNRCDYAWSRNLDKDITNFLPPGQRAVLYGSRDSFVKHYHGKFKTVELESEIFISASQVRKDIITNYPSSIDYRAGVIAATGQHYPQVHTTVDIAILNESNDKLLLGKKPNEKRWRFIGGFADVNSLSFEEDAKREVLEETGLIISDPKYIGSYRIDDYRYRGEKDKITTVFFKANALSGKAEANDDIESIKWFNISDITSEDIIEEHQILFERFNKR